MFFALLLHAVLFVLVRPATSNGLSGSPVAPNTSYLVRNGRRLPMAGTDVRVVSSPVLFSLPSSMGFSRELMMQDVDTPLTFSQPVESEMFLPAELGLDDAVLDSRTLMLTTQIPRTPGVPSDIFQAVEKRPAARRVTLAPELKARMVGGVVLPPELNQEVSKAWEIRAEISVGENGAVRHVFLEQPLESAVMNTRIIRLLHGLTFDPGEPVDGMVEIYSPETKPVVEEQP
ncbi:hypothetical protein P4B35_18710 [Pontiellaceae bacterium B12227]|nr:hypothetical protein [Pontiellaceae bacterium B12227]